MCEEVEAWGFRCRGNCLWSCAMPERPGVSLYSLAQLANSSFSLARTSGSVVGDVAAMRSRSRRGSSAKVRWKRRPALVIRASRIVSARNCRWTFPYFLRSHQYLPTEARVVRRAREGEEASGRRERRGEQEGGGEGKGKVGGTDSFFRIALLASAGPESWSLMASMRSGIPPTSNSLYSSVVSLSIWTVTAV